MPKTKSNPAFFGESLSGMTYFPKWLGEYAKLHKIKLTKQMKKSIEIAKQLQKEINKRED